MGKSAEGLGPRICAWFDPRDTFLHGGGRRKKCFSETLPFFCTRRVFAVTCSAISGLLGDLQWAGGENPGFLGSGEVGSDLEVGAGDFGVWRGRGLRF